MADTTPSPGRGYFKVQCTLASAPTRAARELVINGGDELRAGSEVPPEDRVVSLIFFDRETVEGVSRGYRLPFTQHDETGAVVGTFRAFARGAQ